METLRQSRCSAVWWESVERTSPREMSGNLQDHSTRYPWTELILTGEIQSPVGRCRYSDAKWFSEQEKKTCLWVITSGNKIENRFYAGLWWVCTVDFKPQWCVEKQTELLRQKFGHAKKRPVVFCWLSVVVPKVKILPKGYFQKHSFTIYYLASRSLIDLAYCYWSKKYVYHQFLSYLLPWSWDEFSLRG